MDYELLHEISLIDKEIMKLERGQVNKKIIEELNVYKNKHIRLKNNYEVELHKQKSINNENKRISVLIEEKTKEKSELEDNLYKTNNLKAIENYQCNIDKLNKEIKKLEEEAYQLINDYEIIKTTNSSLVSEINEVRDIYNLELKKYKESQSILKDKLDLLYSQRNKISENLSPESKITYEKIKAEHGFGMSEVKGEICSGCNVDVPVVIINEVIASKKLLKCPNCGRLLYILKV